MADLLDLAAWLYEVYEKSPDSGASSECGIPSEAQKLFREEIKGLDPENPDLEVVTKIQDCVAKTDLKRKASFWFLRELDGAKGYSYLYLFRQRAWQQSGDRYELTVGSRDLVPTFSLDLKAMGIERPSTRFADVGVRRLPDLPFKIELNFAWTDWLRSLARKDLTLAAAVLNLNGKADFESCQVSGQSWLAIKDIPMQIQRITHCLKQATANKIDVLIFPELSIPLEAMDLVHSYANEHNWPRVIVGGIVHQETNGPGYVNECIAWSNGRQTSQRKRCPYVDSANKLTEWLSDPDGVPVRVLPGGSGWSFASAICYDFLDESGSVLTALACCGVNLVAIPALSSKTDIFRQKSQILKSRNQAFIAVSNGCPAPNPKGYVCHAALFDAPIDDYHGEHHLWPQDAEPPLLLPWTLSKV